MVCAPHSCNGTRNFLTLSSAQQEKANVKEHDSFEEEVKVRGNRPLPHAFGHGSMRLRKECHEVSRGQSSSMLSESLHMSLATAKINTAKSQRVSHKHSVTGLVSPGITWKFTDRRTLHTRRDRRGAVQVEQHQTSDSHDMRQHEETDSRTRLSTIRKVLSPGPPTCRDESTMNLGLLQA